MSASPEGPVRMAVIGAGRLGQHHARILSGLAEARLELVVDASASTARSVAGRHGARWSTNLDDALTMSAAVVATPTPTHHAVASRLLDAGVHCLVEKPLTDQLDHAVDLIDRAKKKGLVLQAGHVERFNPAVLEMTRHTSSPVFIEANRLGPYDPRVSHIGVVLDLMIHDIDIVLALTRDRVERVDAVGARLFSAHEDIAKATLHFAGGCRADLTASRVSLKKLRKIRVFQTDAYISLDYSERSLKIFRKKKPQVSSLLDVAIQRPRVAKADALEAELRHFLACVRDKSAPLVGGEQGRDALELALEIRRSMRVHGL